MSAELDARLVKRGLWTNLSEGPILGRTITTDTRTGTLIVALLAVLSSLGTAHLWHLITFLYHQIRAHGLPSDGLFRQQQAILRTLPTPSSLMAESLKLWWFWRNKTDRALTRSAFQFATGLAFALATLAASIFSSYVVDSSNIQVLVRGPDCGAVNTSIGEQGVPFRTYQGAINAFAESFAQDCYQNKTVLPARCNAFVRPNIPFTKERVPCPFSGGMCIGDEAIAMDSGLLDLNHHFGLNLQNQDGVKFRKRTTCSVLPLEGHTTVVNATDYPFNPDHRSLEKNFWYSIMEI
ncbi:hypothetical protein K469DRAFT_714764 [Zopfia rhizophila CBS 207.26]|uniref:Uncharacterized protein n=1 Tax=Zopfia rhizophila CBS 207.26 TaxID=1314779 RepID=A0A6A6DR16_9PEZI|nr:hypothetical protein K469DRAFT_714764 [Zopfia rhizophila CBS 207.26]